MTIVKWLLLIIVILIIVGVYLYMRRANSDNPWHDMEERPSGQQEPTDRASENSHADSYIVGSRKIANETPRDRKAASQKARARQQESQQEPSLDRTRAVKQPSAVKRTQAPKPAEAKKKQ